MCFSNVVYSQHIECFQRVCYNEISQSLVASKAVGECLNLLFGLDSTKIDLKNKKVYFVLGPAHNYFSSIESFWQEFENNVNNGEQPFAQLFYLDKYYQNLYNCDAVIVYEHKKHFSSKTIIKMLKKRNN